MISLTSLPFLCLLTIGLHSSTVVVLAEDSAYVHASRTKRSTCAPKFQVFSGHSACLSGSSKSAVSKADQDLIVREHNKYRAAASPTASNMLKMRWDDEIAMVAQKWADACVDGHDSQRYVPGRYPNVGQNMAFGTADWAETVKYWHDEVSDFTYGDSSNVFLDIGHYTAIMWAETSYVGCGFKQCTNKVYVCNYAPGGNDMNKFNTPYKQGQPCGDCPGHCVDSKLCDCGHNCFNNGELNLATCDCGCQGDNNLYTQPLCELNCTGAVDTWWCPSNGNCPGQMVDCPLKCKVCPYGGAGYTDGGAGGSDNGADRFLVDFVYLLGFHLMLGVFYLFA